jgi:hypothetical protein
VKKNWIISSGMVEVIFDELVENRASAICIKVDDKKYWLPKSQVDFREWSNVVEVPEWLACEKGLL